MKHCAALLLALALVATPTLVAARGLLQAEGGSDSTYHTQLGTRTPRVDATEEGGYGGIVRVVNSTDMPGMPDDLQAHYVTMRRCTVLAAHTHTMAQEFQFVVEGNVTLGIVDKGGNLVNNPMTKGDVGIAPMGLPHWDINDSCEDATLLLVFAGGLFDKVGLGASFGAMGSPVANINLGLDDTAELTVPKGDLLPVSACIAKCNGRK